MDRERGSVVCEVLNMWFRFRLNPLGEVEESGRGKLSAQVLGEVWVPDKIYAQMHKQATDDLHKLKKEMGK